MKKLTVVVILVLCLSVLMIGTALAEPAPSNLYGWCLHHALTASDGGNTCTIPENSTVSIAAGEVLHIIAGSSGIEQKLVISGTLVIEDEGVDDENKTLEVGQIFLGTGTSADGKTTFYGSIENFGTIETHDSNLTDNRYNIHNNSIIINAGAGTITNGGSIVNATGSIDNAGLLTNNGSFINQSASTFANSGQIVNSSSFTNYGQLLNSAVGFITSSGLFENYYGQIDNMGNLENENTGIFENKAKVFNQFGFIHNSGLINNYRCPGEVGVITAGPSNLDNDGTIEFVTAKSCS